MRIGILASHPIQYQAPWFRSLASKVDLRVYFAYQPSAAEQGIDFGHAFNWDSDLLSGYSHVFLKNRSQHPNVNHAAGCDTPQIFRIIRSGSFDAFIVMGWYLKSYRQAVTACRCARVPVLVRGDSQLRTPRSWLKRLGMEVRQRWLLNQFDGFLSVGQRHTEYLQHFGVLPGKIFSAPHCVDNVWFQSQAEILRSRRSEIRCEMMITDDDFVVLFVGKFQTKKRPFDVLKALYMLRSKTVSGYEIPTEIVGLFVGSGDLESDLRSQARALGLKAVFTGFKNQSELPACYVAADVVVLPSDGGETWGLVVNEAMACGLPAVVSDACGCAPDLVEDGLTGFCYPVGEIASLASRLLKMAEIKLQRHEWKLALTEKMRKYSIEEAVSGTLEACSNLSGASKTTAKL